MIFVLAVLLICQQFFLAPVTVKGVSMEPTFENNNKLIVNKLEKVNRFDMIVFHAPDADKNYIKRVIGLPGDKIVFKNDHLYINGQYYKEPYLEKEKEELYLGGLLTGDFEAAVPKGCIFVMGDNRKNSSDSRIFGAIKEDSVIGIVDFRYYPIQSMGSPD